MAHTGVREHPWSRLDCDNLTGLQELSETALLSATKQRYNSNLIYTDVGDILVAVNPFQELPIYDKTWSKAYSRPDVSPLAPHIFRVAARAFNAMMQGKKDQVCVISGESGAGKTESAKFIMYQVMKMCRKSAGLGRQLRDEITQLNPILEAFGNASTALNDNSSRFGKFIQLIFDPSGRVVGAGLEQYLLEKSRVCVQGDYERNFHIFYYLFAGLPEEKLRQLQLKCPTEHRYLRNYPDVLEDCTSPQSKAAFESVVRSMLSVGFEDEEIVSVVALLAGVILIGDIEFRGLEEGEDNARVKNRQVAKAAAQVLELESAGELCFALTTLRTETRGEKVDKKYTCTKAADVRDALAKALYARMFQWIVSRLNGHLQPESSSDHLHIGILDIFGFENFEHNSFEQFCINLANEQLQCYFNHQIFAMEKMELQKEGIDALEISFTDNKPVLDLYLTRPIGILSLLDEQCRGFNGTERAFVLRCKESFIRHPNYHPHKGNAPEFTIKHYAGDVKYVAEGFLEKNKDTLPDTLVDAVKTSSMRLVRTLFRRSLDGGQLQLKKSMMRKSQRSVMRAMSRRKSVAKGAKGGGPKKLLTVSAHFRQSLDLLMERVFSASPHFVRCIKPNQEKKALKCDDEFMLKQLCYTGMLEAVRVRREGFAYRPYFSDFFNGYRGLAFRYTDPRVKGTVVACSEILNKAGLTGWKMGRSRVFLRYYHEEKLQLMLKDIDDKAVLIQKLYRGHLARKWTARLRQMQKSQKIYLTNFLTRINKHGKDHLPRLIEMNRQDILLAKERFGKTTTKPKLSASPSKSYEGLTTRERKLKMAQNLGVKLVPTFTAPPPPSSSPMKKTEQKETTSPTKINHHQHPSQNHLNQPKHQHPLNQSHQHQPNHQQTKTDAPADNKQASTNQQKAVTQSPVHQEKANKDEGSSPSRSHKNNSNSSVVVTHPGASQLRMVGQNVLIADSRGSSIEHKSSSDDYSHPPKSPGRLFTSRKKKTSTDYGNSSEQMSASTKEKGSSRFKLKLPFGRTKDSKSKADHSSSKQTKKPVTKPRGSPSGQPKHHWSPPREPAPPPPQETTPLRTTRASNGTSHYHHGSKSSKDDDRPPSPKMPPPGPATYPQFGTYTNIGSFAEMTDEGSNGMDMAVEEYLVPVKGKGNPEDSFTSHKAIEEDRPPSPKMPPPGPVTLHHRQPLQQSKVQSFSTESVTMKSMSKSLDSVFDEYVPPSSRSQKPLESVTSSKVEDRPPSPKVPPPGPMSYPSLQPLSSFSTASTSSPFSTVASTSTPFSTASTSSPFTSTTTSTGAAGTSSMSLDSILEEFSKMSSSRMGMSMNLF